MIKAIIFDWHGVLDKRTFAGMLEVLAKSWYKTGHFSKDMRFHEYYEMIRFNFYRDGYEYASGRISPEYFWDFLTYEGNYEGIGVAKAENYILSIEPNIPIWDLLTELKKNYRLAILSDCPADKTQIIKNNVDLSLFDYTYFSSDYKILKEDPKFFRLALQDLNLSASECLFIDDSVRNIGYAKRLGFQTILYSNKMDLENILNNQEK